VPYYSDEPYFPTNAEIMWVDKKGMIKRSKPEASATGNFLKIAYLLYTGLRSLRNAQFDVIFANHSLTTYPVKYSGIKGRLVYYIQAYEPEYYQLIKGIKNRVLEYLSKRSYSFNFVKIVNSHLYCSYKEINTDKIVNPGIDLSTFHPKSHTQNTGRTKWRLGTIARHEPQKGTQYILEAYRKLRDQRDDIELVLAFGDDDLADEKENISVTKPDGDANLAAFYRSIDVYICAGTVQHGAVHYPIIESMASSTCVISTPYYPLSCNNGYLISPNDVPAIINAINHVLAEPDSVVKDKIQNGLFTIKQFSWPHVTQKMLNYLAK